MTRNKRWLLASGITIAVAGMLLIASVYTVQSARFKTQLRQGIISSLERSTGARVEINSLSLDWRRATAEIDSLTVHGSEGPGLAPLFRADRVRIQLRLTSLLKRDLDLTLVQLQRPEIHLVVGTDGRTNLPKPPRGALEDLVHVRVHRFTAENGMLLVNLRQIPLQLSGQDVETRSKYDAKRDAYELQFSSRETNIERSDSSLLPVNVAGRLRIERSRIAVQTLRIASGSSIFAASGMVRNLASPVVDFRVSAHIKAAEVAMLAPPLRSLRGGTVILNGNTHYDSTSGTTFQGSISGRKLSYHFETVSVSGIDLDSNLSGSEEHLQFRHLTASGLGAQLAGEAELSHLRGLEVDGEVSQLDFSRAAWTFFQHAVPWSALANGHVHLSGDSTGRARSGSLTADLNLTPGSGSMPVSGRMVFAYKIPAQSFDLKSSRLDFTSTHIAFSGAPNTTMQVALDSTNLAEVHSVISSVYSWPAAALPVIEKNGMAHFDGTVTSLFANPQIAGNVTFANFRLKGNHWDRLQSQLSLSENAADFSALTLTNGPSRVTGSGHLSLVNWAASIDSEMRLDTRLQEVDLSQLSKEVFPGNPVLIAGIVSGSVDLTGRVSDPIGKAHLRIKSLDSATLHMNEAQIEAVFEPNQARVTRGRLQAGSAVVSFSGAYAHPTELWRDGRLTLKIDSNRFPLAGIAEWRKRQPALDANAEIHAQGTIRIVSGNIEPATADGILKLRDIAINTAPFGTLTINAITLNNTLKADLTGDLRGQSLSGAAQVRLGTDSPTEGEIQFDHLDVAALHSILYPELSGSFPFAGAASGRLTFGGALLKPASWRSTLEVKSLELRAGRGGSTNRQKVSDFIFRNVDPLVITAMGGTATLRSFRINGADATFTVSGSVRYDGNQPPQLRSGNSSNLDLRVNGSADLRVLQLLAPNLQASGRANISTSIEGTVRNPTVNGTLDIAQGTFFPASIPNGLSDVNGRIVFNRDRATIQKLTAQSGGGTLTLGGFVSFAASNTLAYHLQANAESVRLRYSGASVTANADLRLTGSSQSSILSGTTTLSRVVFNPNTDIGNLLTAFSAPALAPTSTNDFVSGLHLDVAIESAPNLQLSTALSRDIEAEIDLRLRGTPDHPVLLGNISANQGEIKVFGTKYSINRGAVSFQNAARIEPVVDLDLQTQTRGITVNISISGTANRLNIAYRSDPPLQPRDIIALLTVGRPPDASSNTPRVQSPGDVSSLQANPNTVLGQAISPAPNRLSKLFGITNVKIDPMVQGIVTNTPQARLTLEQQVSRDLTVTYVTNLSQTSEQIFRVEWALNPQYSLVALRDENGEFGIDILYKKRF